MRTIVKSQTDKLEDALVAASGCWVSMPALVEATGSYNIHSRAADLRSRGVKVENRTQRNPRTGQTESFYRIPVPAQRELF
jgi:hypothetical protein